MKESKETPKMEAKSHPMAFLKNAAKLKGKLTPVAAAKIRAKAKMMAVAVLALALCSLQANAAVQTFQVTIGAGVTQVSSTPVNCQWVVFQNNAAHSIRLGDANTTASIGIYLVAGPGGGTFYQGPIPDAATTNLQQFWIAGTQNDVIDVVCNVI